MTALVPLNDIKEMAEVAAKSKMFGFKSPDEAMAIMLLCQAENLHPAIAMRDFHVIQGRPALKADAMLARFQNSGGAVKWEEYTDERVTGTFSHPAGGSVTVTWTFEMAKKIGLTGKDNWKNYARAMLRARCISEGVRTVYPGCVVGVYTPEEVETFKAPSPTIKDMGEAEIVIEEPVTTEFQLFLPDGTVYANCSDWQDYIDRYAGMLGAIQNSPKLKQDEKKQKSKDWDAANAETVKRMDAVTRTRLIAAKQGVDTFEDLEDAIE
jgi:hypothetical protein